MSTALHITKIVGILFAGGVLTSMAEYYLHYSLFDYIKDAVLYVIAIRNGSGSKKSAQ